MSGFTEIECAYAVHIALRFLQMSGAVRPVPFRIRWLIVALNVAHFKGRANTEETRREMCDRIKNAVHPWSWRTCQIGKKAMQPRRRHVS